MNTAEPDYHCKPFERLEGAAVQAYISQFLERTGADPEQHRTYYRCRICDTSWVRAQIEGLQKFALIRQNTEFKV